VGRGLCAVLEGRVGVSMTICIERNFITEEEAAELLVLHRTVGNPQANCVVTPRASRESLTDHPVVHRILKFIHDNYSEKASLDAPSMLRTEDCLKGHKMHDDRGRDYSSDNRALFPTTGHMEWCKHSASVLLSPASEFTGGRFFYEDEDAPSIAPEDQYLTLCYHTNEERHAVEGHEGERVVLLLFLCES
jgi:hypothetical protein